MTKREFTVENEYPYNRSSPVLKNINFTTKAEQTIAIVGQTTLTRLINRIFDTDNGTVKIDGIPTQDWSSVTAIG